MRDQGFACSPSALPLSRDHLEGDKLRSRLHNGSNTDPSPAQNAGSGLRLRILTPVRAKPARTGDSDSRYAHARKAAQIVKEHLFWLPGQPLKRLNINS
jgi:hypothetical protein